MPDGLIAAGALKELAAAGAARNAEVVGAAEGFFIRVDCRGVERTLRSQRGGVRFFATLDAAARELKRCGIARAELELSGYEFPGSRVPRTMDLFEP